jgi:cysteine desulfurase
MTPIYLDHNATTPLLPEVADAMREAALRYIGNPASQHEPGRHARRALEAARRRIAELLGAASDDRVILTSGGTEANNLALTGLGGAATSLGGQFRPSSPGRGDSAVADLLGASATFDDAARPNAPHLVISALEHPSVARTAEHLAALGWRVDRLPVDADGVVQVAALEPLLRLSTRFVSVMLASNETGVMQPVTEIAAICHTRGIPVHTDATQVVGKLPVDFTALGVDALTFTGHKFHGPLGIGALLVRRGVTLAPSLHGGFQQGGLRPGTESVALAIGLAMALQLWSQEADARRERMTLLRISLERQLLAGDPHAVVIGAAAPRLPHTANVGFPGLDRQALVMALDLAGIACSTGSACASGSSEPSPALVAMGLPEEQISSSLRFSLGATTTAAEVDEAARRILSVVNRLRRG